MSLTFPCVYCTDDLKCTKYTDDEATSFCVLGPCKDEKPSHGDRIRAMSDEELAMWAQNHNYCPPGYSHCVTSTGEQISSDMPCDECWKKWLKKEADNG